MLTLTNFKRFQHRSHLLPSTSQFSSLTPFSSASSSLSMKKRMLRSSSYLSTSLTLQSQLQLPILSQTGQIAFSFRSFSTPTNNNHKNTNFHDMLNKIKDEYNDKGEKINKEETSDTTANVKDEGKSEGKEDKAKENGEEGVGTNNENQPPVDYGQLFTKTLWKTRDMTTSFLGSVKETWKEMIEGPKESKIRKTVAHANVTRTQKTKSSEEDGEDDKEPIVYDGPTALVVSKTKRSTWEEMAARLENSPLIREMLKNSRKIGRQAASTDLGKQAQKIGEQVSNKIHDAREFWETTQNPIVYQLSGVWENLTSPTEEGMAVAEIQRLDPEFRKEDWADEIKREIAPMIIQAHLNGDLKILKPRLGEAVYNKLAADIRTRKADGISIDTRILDIDELQVIIRYLETEGPLILVVYMVQQINCIRNREGEIIEGNENHVIAKFYTLAFKQVFDDDEGTVDWKIVDYELQGGETYF